MDVSKLTRDQLWSLGDMLDAFAEVLRPHHDPTIEAARVQILRCRHRHPLGVELGDVERMRDEANKRGFEIDREENERAAKERAERQAHRSPASAAGHSAGGWTLRQETTRCGKDGCECRKGHPHGPYWYGYKTISGRVRKRYFGKDKPTQTQLDRAEAKLLGKGAAATSTASPKKRRGLVSPNERRARLPYRSWES